jgi:uncharacterized protein YndB with AHSA1/START domain
MKSCFATIPIILSLSFSLGFAQPSTEDELLEEASGVTVRVHPVKDLAFGEIRATGEFDATPEEVFDLLWDISSHKNFMALVKDSSNISLEANKRIDHIVFSGSLPGVKDRDVVSETKVTVKTEQKIAFQYRQVEGVGPEPSKDVVRLKLRVGGWELIPIDGGKRTKANYWFRSDPGVDLGVKVMQKFTAKNVVDLFEAIRTQLKKK